MSLDYSGYNLKVLYQSMKREVALDDARIAAAKAAVAHAMASLKSEVADPDAYFASMTVLKEAVKCLDFVYAVERPAYNEWKLRVDAVLERAVASGLLNKIISTTRDGEVTYYIGHAVVDGIRLTGRATPEVLQGGFDVRGGFDATLAD